VELDGKMYLIDNVEILNISFGGVSLKADRELNIGKEYLLTLVKKGKSIDVKGIAVRSALSSSEERTNGERVTLYTASMKFKDGQTEKIADFLNLIEQHKKEEVPVMVDQRRSVRFHITIPVETVLSHSAKFKVKKISLSGMLIQSEQALEINGMIPMGLSFNAGDPVNFIGRVASCQMANDKGQAYYAIGVEFTDLTDKGRTLLKTFIDDLAVMKANPEEEKADK
jgi:hypothetical protein